MNDALFWAIVNDCARVFRESTCRVSERAAVCADVVDNRRARRAAILWVADYPDDATIDPWFETFEYDQFWRGVSWYAQGQRLGEKTPSWGRAEPSRVHGVR